MYNCTFISKVAINYHLQKNLHSVFSKPSKGKEEVWSWTMTLKVTTLLFIIQKREIMSKTKKDKMVKITG